MALSIGELVGYLDLDTSGAEGAGGRLGGILEKLPWGKAVAGATVMAAGVTGALFGIGGVFDDLSDSIRVGTGATGDELDALTDVGKKVGDTIPAAFGEIGPVLSDVHSRMGATGDDLQLLTEQFLEAGRMSGEVIDTQAVTGAFNAFGLGPKAASAAMDQLWSISQQTGTSMSTLASDVARNAPVLQQFGFSIGQSANLLGSLDAAGIDGNRTMATLSRAMVTFAKDGKAPKKALQDTVSGISDLLAKGDQAGAVNLAGKVFGTRGAAQFVAAVKSGKVNVDSLFKAAGKGGDTILGAADDTADFAEQWQLFKNDVLLAVEPVATRVFGAISSAMADFVANGAPAIATWVQGVANGEGKVGAFVTVLTTLAGVVANVVGFFNQHRTVALTLAAAIAALTVVTQVHGAILAVQAAGGMVKYLQGMKLISGATKVWAAVQWAMNAALTANPIGIAVVAIAALVAALVIAYKKSATFRAIVQGALNGVKAAASALGSFFTKWGAKIAGVFQAAWGKVKSASVSTWNAIKTAASAVWNAITGAVKAGVHGVVSAVQGLASLPGRVAGFFASMVSSAANKIGELIKKAAGIPGKVKGAVGNLGNLLTSAGRALIQGFLNGIEALWSKVTSKFDSIKGLADKAASLASHLPGVGKRSNGSLFFGPLMDAIQAQENPVRDVLRDMADFIGNEFDAAAEKSANAVDKRYDKLAAQLRKKLKGKALDKALAKNDKARDKALGKANKAANAAQAAYMATTQVVRQQLAQNIANQAANQEALDTAEQQLQDAIKLRDDYAQGVSGSARDYAFTFDADSGVASAQSYVDQVQAKLTELVQFRQNMAKLSGVLDEQTYQDMIDKGVEGAGDMAQALANDPQAAQALADLSRQVNAAADGLGADASTHLFQAGVNMAQSAYDGLVSKQDQLVTAANELGLAMAAALEDALSGVGSGGGGGKGGKGKGKGKGGGKKHRTGMDDVPGLATGGRATGPTLAYIGEGREAETVLPDSVLRGLLTRVHAAGKAEARAELAGRTGPIIGQVIQQPGESAEALGERLWFKTRTRG